MDEGTGIDTDNAGYGGGTEDGNDKKGQATKATSIASGWSLPCCDSIESSVVGLFVALNEHRDNAKGHIADGSGKSDNSVPDIELASTGGSSLEDNSIFRRQASWAP